MYIFYHSRLHFCEIERVRNSDAYKDWFSNKNQKKLSTIILDLNWRKTFKNTFKNFLNNKEMTKVIIAEYYRNELRKLITQPEISQVVKRKNVILAKIRKLFEIQRELVQDCFKFSTIF